MLGDAALACCISGSSSTIDIASGDRVGRGISNGRAVLLYHSTCSFVFRGFLVSWSSQFVIISFVGLVALVSWSTYRSFFLFVWFVRVN